MPPGQISAPLRDTQPPLGTHIKTLETLKNNKQTVIPSLFLKIFDSNTLISSIDNNF